MSQFARVVSVVGLGLVVGFVLSRWVSRHAGGSVGRSAFVVVSTAAVFGACGFRLHDTAQLASSALLASLLVVLFFVNLETWMLPYDVTLPGSLLGVVSQSLRSDGSAIDAFGGLAAGFLGLRLLELATWAAFRKEVIGAGIKFMFGMVGAFLGWRALTWVFALSVVQNLLLGGVRSLFIRAPAHDGAGDPPTRFTPLFSRRRSLGTFVFTLLLQPIPDDVEPSEDQEGQEEAPAWLVPMGPGVAVAALEVILLGAGR